LRFLVDAQLPPILTDWLIGKGHAAAHVTETAGLDAPDAQIWNLAVASDYVIITKDRDFVEWARTRSPKARVVWIRFGNMRRDVLLANLEIVWDRLEEALAEGVSVVEVGR
jgi:predicted nuclease of predicted toxin-antitoxin system